MRGKKLRKSIILNIRTFLNLSQYSFCGNYQKAAFGSFFLFWLLPVPTIVWAHVTLYQNVELNLRRPGVFELIFTIHAPELVGQPDTGEAGASWLTRLSDADLESLVAKARLWLPTQVEVLVNGKPLAVDAFSVESLTMLRSSSSSGETPAGCFLASLALPLPEEPSELKIVYANDVPKRLLLTVSRPKTFPEPRDLGAGDSTVVSLPAGPARPPANGISWGLALVLGLGLLLLGAWWQRRPAGLSF